MNNKDVIYKLNRIAERIKEGNYSDALFLDEDDATACKLGATAIQKIDAMKLHLNSLYGNMVSSDYTYADTDSIKENTTND